MILLRISGAVLLTLSGMVAAYVVNSAESASLSQTEGIIAFIRLCRVRIDCFSLPIGEILRGCGKKELSVCGYTGSIPPRDLSALVFGCRISDAAAHKLFSDFASEFGRGYRDEQLKACDYYLSMLEDHRQKLADSLPAKRKRNGAICVCASVALAILLL